MEHHATSLSTSAASSRPTDVDAGESTGASRVFMLTEGGEDGQRLLRSVLRDVPSTPDRRAAGPVRWPERAGARGGPAHRSCHPRWSCSPRGDVAGTLNVDLSPEILELQSSALRYAVAQIVYTADELDGVRSVRLRVDGEIQAWPAGGGELRYEPLTVYDFPGFAESAQPAYPAIPPTSRKDLDAQGAAARARGQRLRRSPRLVDRSGSPGRSTAMLRRRPQAGSSSSLRNLRLRSEPQAKKISATSWNSVMSRGRV